MLPETEIKDFAKVTDALRTEIIRSKSRILPFRYFYGHSYDGSSQKNILVIGKTPPATLKAIKKGGAKIKAEGEARLVGKELRLLSESEVNMARLTKFFKEAKLKFSIAQVNSFEGDSGDKHHALILAQSKQRFADFKNRLEKLVRAQVTGSDMDNAMTHLGKAKKILEAGEIPSAHYGKLEEHLDEVAKSLGPLQKKFGAQISDSSEGATKSESQAETTRRELENIKALDKVSSFISKKNQTSIKTILAAREKALRWQKNEMAEMLQDKDEFERLQSEFRTDESAIEDAIKTANAELETATDAARTMQASMKDVSGNEQKRRTKKLSELLKPMPRIRDEIEKLERSLVELRQTFSTARAQVSKGDKHGTGRHGAHTGLEQQALRAAAGGTSADQEDNEWGDSRDKAAPEKSTSPASGPNKESWTMGGEVFELEYEDGVNGERTIKNQSAALANFEKIARKIEARGAKTSTSSNFLSPELEMEAAERAKAVAKQCVWDETWDDQKNAWVPIDRFFVYVGPPKKIRSKGWGHSVVRDRDEEGNSVAKMKLVQANKVLNAFRKGKISPDQMMKAMNVSMATEGKGKGATLQPVARVMIDRAGSGWTNTSQYPSTDKPGWSLKGAKVRKSREGGDGVTAPEATGT